MRTRMQCLCVALIGILFAAGTVGISLQRAHLGGTHLGGSDDVGSHVVGSHVVVASAQSMPSSSDDDMMKHPGRGTPDLVRCACTGSYFPPGAAVAPDAPFTSNSVSWAVWTRPTPESRICSDSCGARAPPLAS